MKNLFSNLIPASYADLIEMTYSPATAQTRINANQD